MTTRTRSSLIQLVEKNIGTAENPEIVEVFVGRIDFEATSHGELTELFYFIAGLIGEVDTSAGTTQQPTDDKPAEGEPNKEPSDDNKPEVEGEPRRKRIRRTAAQIKADDEAEAAQKLADNQARSGMTMGTSPAPSTKPEVDSPFKEIPAPEAPKAPEPPPAPPAPVATVSAAMRDATKPREVVRAIFDEDKDADKEPRQVEEVVSFVRAHLSEIPCIAAMGDGWEERVRTIAATIRSGLTIG